MDQMNQGTPPLPGRAQLDAHSDEALQSLINEARHVLKSRAAARKREALRRIKELAKQHGLDVAVQDPAKKRGRPPKAASLEPSKTE